MMQGENEPDGESFETGDAVFIVEHQGQSLKQSAGREAEVFKVVGVFVIVLVKRRYSDECNMRASLREYVRKVNGNE